MVMLVFDIKRHKNTSFRGCFRCHEPRVFSLKSGPVGTRTRNAPRRWTHGQSEGVLDTLTVFNVNSKLCVQTRVLLDWKPLSFYFLVRQTERLPRVWSLPLSYPVSFRLPGRLVLWPGRLRLWYFYWTKVDPVISLQEVVVNRGSCSWSTFLPNVHKVYISTNLFLSFK